MLRSFVTSSNPSFWRASPIYICPLSTGYSRTTESLAKFLCATSPLLLESHLHLPLLLWLNLFTSDCTSSSIPSSESLRLRRLELNDCCCHKSFYFPTFDQRKHTAEIIDPSQIRSTSRQKSCRPSERALADLRANPIWRWKKSTWKMMERWNRL